MLILPNSVYANPAQKSAALPDLEILQYLSLIEMPEVSDGEDGEGNGGKRELRGLSNSDVLMHLSWYREALP